MDRLTNEIKQLSDDYKETEESKERRQDLKRRINEMVNESKPGAEVVVVGSCGNGFGTKNSDLDLTIIPSSRSAYCFLSTNILMKIELCLNRHKSLFTDIEVILLTCCLFEIAKAALTLGFAVVNENGQNF